MRSRAAAVFSALTAVAASLAIVALAAIVLRRAVDVPYWDEWEFTDYVVAAHTHALSLALLWSAHNEHRMVFPRLIVLALDALGGWSTVREQFVSLTFLAATQYVFWRLLRRTVAPERRGPAFLVATALLLSLCQYENLEWGFQMAWFLCDLCAVVAVYALTAPGRRARNVLIAICAGIIGSWSSSQGLIVWLSGAVAIALVPRRMFATLALWLGVGSIVAVITEAGNTGNGGGHAGLADPQLLAQYMLVYLGMPLALQQGVDVAQACGALALVWLGALCAAARRSMGTRLRLAPWLAIAVYALAAAFVTGVGRAGFGIVQAGSSRYTSIAVLLWASLVAATCAVVPRERRAIAFAAVPIALVLAASLQQTRVGNTAWHAHTAEMRAARAALAAGDLRGLPLIFPDPAHLIVQLGELARIHDGVFIGR